MTFINSQGARMIYRYFIDIITAFPTFWSFGTPNTINLLKLDNFQRIPTYWIPINASTYCLYGQINNQEKVNDFENNKNKTKEGRILLKNMIYLSSRSPEVK